jgi:hypothetical protein
MLQYDWRPVRQMQNSAIGTPIRHVPICPWAIWNLQDSIFQGGNSTRRPQERGRNQDGDVAPAPVSAHSSGTAAVSISARQNRVPQIPSGGRLGPVVWVARLAGPACLALPARLGCRGVLAVPAWPAGWPAANVSHASAATFLRRRRRAIHSHMPRNSLTRRVLAPEMRAPAEPRTLNP